MRPGKRFGLSANEKSDIWSRWKSGQALHEIGRACGKPHDSVRCCLAEEFLPPLAGAPVWHSRWLSERISREGSLPARRFVK